ncbi:FimV/HubP family polar landmark protein [Luteimonas sp. RC10]|uniref:FimV/HubP family polar landmark protein n=1 Tax=Luteimonas sp. RC10 TaxID=2587035 RepID=UPI00160DE23F|nr:FimV/HubP family polar landmark protein [Luteimonas sp. RC10]MBB3344104.1 pilus assembly protein FimV [Luteimonas sp. RC10]
MNRGKVVSRIVQHLLVAGALLGVAGPASALGLGRIEVRSQQGEPLLAEIPVISSDPAELRQLQARLASPETFARIGLAPPRGVVSDLRFGVALDARGRPVIRVTSAAPVQQAALAFLVEVDWGQGRLVREYSALLAVPDTVAAEAQPEIQAPVAAPADAIVRPAVVTATETPAAPAPVQAQAPTASQQAPAPATPPATPVRTAPRPAPPPVRPAASIAQPASDRAQTLPAVRPGQTLSTIAAPLAREAGISVNQAMVLLLRHNPDAFIGGNLNLIRQGAVLRVPPRDDWAEAGVAEADALVRQQVGQWRDMRQPAAAPVATAPAAATTPPPTAPRAAPAAPAAVATPSARLEITPPAGDAAPAATQSGIAAGAGGNMLRQDPHQAEEAAISRDAELAELRSRLDDLEQLQRQQQRLIEMKDADLAAAQQRLDAAQASPGAPWSWLWLTPALLVVGALAFLLGRRGRRAAAARTTLSAVDGSPAAAQAADVVPAFARSAPPAAAPVAAPVVPPTGEPTWHVGDTPPAPDTAPAPAPAPVQAPVELDRGDAVEPPPGIERLELARAYIDLGDVDTARGLLQDVADGGDPVAAAEAVRLLRTLG